MMGGKAFQAAACPRQDAGPSASRGGKKRLHPPPPPPPVVHAAVADGGVAAAAHEDGRDARARHVTPDEDNNVIIMGVITERDADVGPLRYSIHFQGGGRKMAAAYVRKGGKTLPANTRPILRGA